MNTQRTHTVIATSTCLTLGLAVAVAMGAVPRATGSEPAPRAAGIVLPQPTIGQLLRPAVRLATTHQAASHVRSHARVVHAHVASTAVAPAVPAAQNPLISDIAVQPVAAAGASAEAANIRHQPAKHKKHHHKKKAHHHKKKAPAKPQLAPRTKPSASAVSSAIAGLRNYVHTPLTPTASQVAQFGDAVCSAFDQNQTFSQVKATILAKVKQLPFTTVEAGAADYVVKTAVSLYCPGYKSKVG